MLREDKSDPTVALKLSYRVTSRDEPKEKNGIRIVAFMSLIGDCDSATKAEVEKLYLIHYASGRFAKGDLASEARKTFQGEVVVAKDCMTIDL